MKTKWLLRLFLMTLCLLVLLTAIPARTLPGAKALEGTGEDAPDSVFQDRELLALLPGRWTEKTEEAEAVLILEDNGNMSLAFSYADGKPARSCAGAWSLESQPDAGSRLTLLFTSTDDPARAGEDYRVECVYEAYTESWVENDALVTCLNLNPPVSCSGISPFEEAYGYDASSLLREQGPNRRVVRCKSFVSLREKRAASSRRLAKVPLGALVLAFPEEGEENGFIACVYQGKRGYILSEYLQPAE